MRAKSEMPAGAGLSADTHSTHPKRRKKRQSRLEFLDDWQYRIFKVIVFVIFVVYSLQFLNDKIHITSWLSVGWRFFKSLFS